MSDPSDSAQNDLSDFLQSMGDVTPIKSDKRVSLNKKAVTNESLKARRAAAASETFNPDDPLSGDFSKAVDPNATLEYQRPGIQNGVFKSLRLGKYAIEARLDLHHHTVEQARIALFAFIKDCQQYEIRCALITHGKGEGRKEPARLKSCVDHWLPQMEAVMAFHSAQQHHGGSGATYVLLRKSKKPSLADL